MNLRCIYCQTPFTLGLAEMLSAIVNMNEKGQNHYDAHCPRCRRANSISRQRMELFYPNWKNAPKPQAPVPPSLPASAALKTQPVSRAKKAAAGIKSSEKKAPAVKNSPAAAAKKPAGKKSTEKPAAKKASVKNKKK